MSKGFFVDCLGILKSIGRLLHWCTGWLCHSDAGCKGSFDPVEEVRDMFNSENKEN